MIRIAVCTVALFGFSHFALAGEPNESKSQPRGSQESTSSSHDHYYPSSGLTLEALKALPPRYNTTMVYPIYQPYYYGGFYPYNAFYPYTFGPMSYGMGGYMPPGVNRYSSVGAVSLWIW